MNFPPFLAKQFGATDCVNPKEVVGKTIQQYLVEVTDGGFDYTFECIGNIETMVGVPAILLPFCVR